MKAPATGSCSRERSRTRRKPTRRPGMRRGSGSRRYQKQIRLGVSTVAVERHALDGVGTRALAVHGHPAPGAQRITIMSPSSVSSPASRRLGTQRPSTKTAFFHGGQSGQRRPRRVREKVTDHADAGHVDTRPGPVAMKIADRTCWAESASVASWAQRGASETRPPACNSPPLLSAAGRSAPAERRTSCRCPGVSRISGASCPIRS